MRRVHEWVQGVMLVKVKPTEGGAKSLKIRVFSLDFNGASVNEAAGEC